MNEVRDAELSDIYVDLQGKLWRVIATCGEPTVEMEEVEGYISPPTNLTGAQSLVPSALPGPQIVRSRKRGGISGAMWDGWKRIYRPGEAR